MQSDDEGAGVSRFLDWPRLSCVVSGAGLQSANGHYYRDGECCGKPRYKHESNNNLFIRTCSDRFEGFGITTGREGASPNWAYFCQASHGRDDLEDIPNNVLWITHGGCGASEPAPSVTVEECANADMWSKGVKTEKDVPMLPTVGGFELCVIVVDAGCKTVNGRYLPDGDFLGRPRYKHENLDLFIRQGGKQFQGYGITAGRESVPGPWAYFCKTSQNRHDLMDLPDDAEWVTQFGFGVDDPAPKVFLQKLNACFGAQPDEASLEVFVDVLGAGNHRMNGRYLADGEFRGMPRYKHHREDDLYIRQGGHTFQGYGITVGRESAPGPWCYFCVTSHDRDDLLTVPDAAQWVTHGGFEAVSPAPSVRVRSLRSAAENYAPQHEDNHTDIATIGGDLGSMLDLRDAGVLGALDEDTQMGMQAGNTAWAIGADLLWDGIADEASPGLCVVVEGVKLSRVCSMLEAERLGIPLEIHEGCCIMPGIIDAHVHMEFSEEFPLHDQPTLSREELLAAMAERAGRMVRSGITTARDLGGSASFATVALRKAIDADQVIGPRLLCAGQPITIPGGHCHQWGGAASTIEEAQAVIERQVANGCDWIKIMVTGGVRTPGSNPALAQFSDEAMQSLVAMAEGHNRPVAAHAHGVAGVRAAVRAGCRTVEHCTWLSPGAQWGCVDEGVVEMMAAKGIAVAPTAHANWIRQPMGGSNFRRMSAALSCLRQAGVSLMASSDAGAIPGLPHDALAGGVAMLATMTGMSPVEALRCATSGCAKAIGVGDHCGRLAPGYSADILLVRGDPTWDLNALKRPHVVVVKGQRVRDESSSFAASNVKNDVAPPPTPPAIWRRFHASRKTRR